MGSEWLLLALLACGAATAPEPPPTAAAPLTPTVDAMDDPATLRADCEAGDGPSCFNLGLMLLNGEGVAADPEAALGLFGQACAQSVEAGCENRDALYLRVGRALKAAGDSEGAARVLRQGCDAISGQPCTDLGVMTLAGMDAAAALVLFKRGCAGGDPAGCINAARAYYAGEGVEKDLRLARQYLSTACQGGSQPACERLAAITPEAPGAQ